MQTKNRFQWFWGCCLFLLLASPGFAQIAPECEGVAVPADYEESKQQAFMQNYFAASFLMTPMGPILPYEPGRAGIGLELGAIPPLSCEQRLVLGGTKTEDTNGVPVHPRPRLMMSLPDIGPVSSFAGLTVMPPIRSPFGTMLQAGAEAGVGWRSSFGLSLGLRAHLNFGRMRAEIATPFAEGDPAVDDLFFSSTLGGDLGAAYQLPWQGWQWLRPYLSVGIADVSTLFIIGDDAVLVENTDHPWWGPTFAAGTQTRFLDGHLEWVVEVSSAFPVLTTAKTKIGVVW